MAPSRGKGKTRARGSPTSSSIAGGRSTRVSRRSKDSVSDVYDDLLAEAASVDSPEEGSDRPLKRRRVAARAVPDRSKVSNGPTNEVPNASAQAGQRHVQVIEDYSLSEDDSDESEYDFENVELGQNSGPEQQKGGEDDQGIVDVSVAVDAAPKRQIRSKQKPVTTAEKAHRVLIHKYHLLCLLGHCIYVNSWCNDGTAQQHLRPLLSRKVVTFLNPRSEDSQFRQNEAFMDGLSQAAEVFRGEFKVTASGMRSAQWAREAEEEVPRQDRAEFISAAKRLEGSQDTGNQLFCTLLRAVGVEARLVCSLQPLPFASSSIKSSTPQKSEKPTLRAKLYDTPSPGGRTPASDAAIASSSTIGSVPAARRRLGQPTFDVSPLAPTYSPSRPKQTIVKLTHPVFWVEAFNSAHQKWIAVDPIVTRTTNKPSRLEPPSSDTSNHLSYAIAFEASAVARDVTRRYARAFNAKTRRSRLDSTEDGSAWLKRVLRIFRRRGGRWDRDQVEDSELVQREAREGLPANVLNFKDHPYYALERHMKRHEVIFPKREVGKVNAGTAAKPRMEAVFRRQDVCICRSADKWYRLGRIVKTGEIAVKRVVARRIQRARSPSQDDGDEEGRSMTPLYAAFQTEAYVPPPVVHGKVPRNPFGNLDVYVPSMVPAGGEHIRHPLARDAALVLKVDAVDAVVGFQFKGRQGTAVTDGVIVPADFADAVEAVINGLEQERVEERSRERSLVALRMWKRLLTGLRIRERVSAYGDKSAEVNGDVEAVSENEREGDNHGFFATIMTDDESLPTAGRYSLVELMTPTKKGKARKKYEESDEEPSFDGYDDDENSIEERVSTSRRNRRNVVDDDSGDEYVPQIAALASSANGEEAGGGFMPDDTMDEGERETHGRLVASYPHPGGGFVPDDPMESVDGGIGLAFNTRNEEGGYLPDALPRLASDDSGRGFIADDEADEVRHPAETGVDDETEMHIDGQHVETGQIETSHDDSILQNKVVVADGKPAIGMNPDATGRQGHLIDNKVVIEETTADSIGLAQGIAHLSSSPNDATIDEVHATYGSDQGSMLSHDPEDEDAEPDWLESD